MKKRRDSSSTSDIEKLNPTVAEFGDALGGDPLSGRLGDLWTDFVRVPDEAKDPEAPKKSGSAVPLLDDMKGIRQWD